MSNWALVIGIDSYQPPVSRLQGAVRDAIAMCDWLLDVDGGAVPSANLRLLLGRDATSPTAPAGLHCATATCDSVKTTIHDFLQRSEGATDRLFFYFAGHGLTNWSDFSAKNAIVASDFSLELTDKAITIESIADRFQAEQFKEQYLFIDACRNFPTGVDFDFRFSSLPRPRRPKPPVPDQFIMAATSQLTRAHERPAAQGIQGVFTQALLDGLRGSGSAKVFDEARQLYIVTWNRLFRYVESIVRQRQLEAHPDMVQVPREYGEHGSTDPTLVRFGPIATFGDAELCVDLDPQGTGPNATVVVGHLGGPVETRESLAELPTCFALPPRTYSVRASAPRHRPQKPYYPVDLYDNRTLQIGMKPRDDAESRPVTRGGEPPIEPVDEADLTRGLGGERTLGGLLAESEDRTAIVEIADQSGQVLKRSYAAAAVRKIDPGFYQARLISPEGIAVQQLVEVLPGKRARVKLGGSAQTESGMLRDVVNRAQIKVEEGVVFAPAPGVDAVATAELTTLLALAAAAANDPAAPADAQIRDMGVRSFGAFAGIDATSGIQVILAAESAGPLDAANYLAGIRLKCWKQKAQVPADDEHPLADPEIVGLAQYGWAKAPGPYWLSVETADQGRVAFAVTVLPGRLALIVLYRDEDGRYQVFQYLPALTPEERAEWPHDMRLLQRSELLQRAYARGARSYLEDALGEGLAIEMLYLKWMEPIAGCLGGYALLLSNPDQPMMEVATENMSRHFGGLSDSHVLRAEYQSHLGHHDAARESYATALDCGCPVVCDGLHMLLAGLTRYEVADPRIENVRAVAHYAIDGQLWTSVPV